MGNVKKYVAERTRHKREYDKRMNERQMQSRESKVVSSKALDASLVVTECSGTKLDEHITSSSSGTYITHVVDANIRPVNDQDSSTEVDSNTTLDSTNMYHIGGEIDQDAEQDQKQIKNVHEKSNKAKVKHDIDVIETINIELEHKVAKLLKENKTLKMHYKDLYDSIKVTRTTTLEQTTSLIAKNDKFKAQLQEKGFTIAALKNKLRKLTGNSVNTKFAKPSILEKPVLQPLRNQSVFRQPTVYRSERPKFSKPQFSSQVDVNNVLSKPVTPHYLPKVRESVFVKPNHVITSGSSRNSTKESYRSNDMAHNYYLDEAKKKTQNKIMNLKPSVMHTTSLQNTTNSRKPKPRSKNQTSRSLPVPKSSYGMLNRVTLVDHSRNSSSFLDSKHFVCSTCQKYVFNDNHDDCITKFLKEVNSRAKVQSPKSRNSIKPAKRIPNVNKSERWISKGYRFSLNKSSDVHEKPNTPRSYLRWKLMGRIFKTVSLRWIPTGKMFIDCTTKVDSEPLNGLNDDITNPYECNQTLNVSACTLNLSAGPGPQLLTPGKIRSGLVPQPPSPTPNVSPVKNDRDTLFCLMFDEYFNPSPSVSQPALVAAVQEHVVSTSTPSSTRTDQDTPSTSTSQTIKEAQSYVIPTSVEEDDHGIEVAYMDNDLGNDCDFRDLANLDVSINIITILLYTSSLLNAACKKYLYLLKKGLMVRGKLRKLPSGEYRDRLQIANMDKITVPHPLKLNLPIEKTIHLKWLMCLLIHSNFFNVTKLYDQDGYNEKEGYVLIVSSKLLLKKTNKNSPNLPSLLPFANLILDLGYMSSFNFFGSWFKGNESTVFETAFGTLIWELFANENPRLNKLFNDAMESNFKMMKFAVQDNKEIFKGVDSLVDVGGGTGLVAKILLEAFPHMNCIVLDLPHVVADMKDTMNLKYVGGDIFSSIPHADAVILEVDLSLTFLITSLVDITLYEAKVSEGRLRVLVVAAIAVASCKSGGGAYYGGGACYCGGVVAAWLGGANELFEAQAHIYRHIFNYATSMSLKCALELGIPDIIHDHEKPITIQELVSKLNFPVEKTHNLQRLMRLLIHENFFSITKFHDQEGEEDKEGTKALSLGILGDSQMMSLVVKDSIEIFEGVDSLVDVGGGTGLNAKILLEAFPEMTCTVFDLPHVVANKVETANVKYVG
nr:trans-resveratrol di-O-methyltransferase-like [Tanacetum cinerariifolium]